MADLDNNVDAIIDIPNEKIDYFSSLNDFCLIKIFEELNLLDLIKMSQASRRFDEIIKEFVIGRRLIDISEISGKFAIRKAFKMFGNYIEKLKISSKDLQYKSEERTEAEEIFAIIQNFCTPNKLVQLELQASLSDVRKKSFIKFAPMLSNVQCLILNSSKTKYLRPSELNQLLSGCTSLRILRAKPVNFYTSFIDYNLIANLEELSIEDCRTSNLKGFREYFAANPNLKKFSFKQQYDYLVNNRRSSEELISIVADSLPNLESLSLSAIENSRINYDMVLNLRNLKQLKINSSRVNCKDILPFLKNLALQNTLEELIIDLQAVRLSADQDNEIEVLLDFPEFSSLRSLEIIEPMRQSETFLTQFIDQLPNLTKCILRSNKLIVQSIILGVAARAMNLSELVLLASRNSITNSLHANIHNAKMRNSNFKCLELRVIKWQSSEFNRKRTRQGQKFVRITSYDE